MEKLKFSIAIRLYEDYIKKQIEKTTDPERISKWKGEEWQIKVDGFKHIFNRNVEFIKNKKKSNMLRISNWARSICIKGIRFRSNRYRLS